VWRRSFRFPAVPAGLSHNWTLKPFHMMGVAGDSGRWRCCALNPGATVENTLF